MESVSVIEDADIEPNEHLVYSKNKKEIAVDMAYLQIKEVEETELSENIEQTTTLHFVFSSD
jgi:hypothetical protein